MTDHNPADTVEHTSDTVTDKVGDIGDAVIPEPIAEVTEHPSDEIPPWGSDLIHKVEGLIESVAALPSAAVEEALPDMPGHGDIVKDESPIKLPWTHKTPFNH